MKWQPDSPCKQVHQGWIQFITCRNIECKNSPIHLCEQSYWETRSTQFAISTRVGSSLRLKIMLGPSKLRCRCTMLEKPTVCNRNRQTIQIRKHQSPGVSQGLSLPTVGHRLRWGSSWLLVRFPKHTKPDATRRRSIHIKELSLRCLPGHILEPWSVCIFRWIYWPASKTKCGRVWISYSILQILLFGLEPHEIIKSFRIVQYGPK